MKHSILAIIIVLVGIACSVGLVSRARTETEQIMHCGMIAQNCFDGAKIVIESEKSTPHEMILLMTYCSEEWIDNQCPQIIYRNQQRREGHEI